MDVARLEFLLSIWGKNVLTEGVVSVLFSLPLLEGEMSCFFFKCAARFVVFPEYLTTAWQNLQTARVLSVEPSFLWNPKCFQTNDLKPKGERISSSSWTLACVAAGVMPRNARLPRNASPRPTADLTATLRHCSL